MKNLFKQNAVFIVLSLILLLVLGLVLIYIPKGELHILLCDRHTHTRDIFYRYYTQIAEWFPYVVCVLLLLFSRIGDGIFASSAMLLSALSTQLFKHLINAPRPVTWFAANMPEIELPMVDGVSINHWFSFPSGHTTSFFSLAFVLCILVTRWLNNRSQKNALIHYSSLSVQLVLFFLATLGAYSRIYLSQHFAMDIFGGMIVGITITMVCYAIFSRYMDKKWYNYRLFPEKSR